MIARVTTFQASPDKYEEGVRRIQEHTIPTAKQQGGFRHGFWFGDRQTGKMVAVTLWENEAALQASEAAASQLRAQSEQIIGTTVVSMEQFEIIGEA